MTAFWIWAKTNFSGDLTSLFLNEDGKFFTDVSAQAGLGARQLLGWGAAFVDFDDDGWERSDDGERTRLPGGGRRGRGRPLPAADVAVSQFGQRTLCRLDGEGGPGFRDSAAVARLAVGDLDGDGRPEAVILNMNDAPSVLKNTAAGGNFLNVRLKAVTGNRAAIGARVTVVADGKRQIDEVMSGSSFYSQNSLTLHFGVGKAKRVEQVTVHWLGGKTESWKGLAVNAVCELTEGQAEPACRSY